MSPYTAPKYPTEIPDMTDLREVTDDVDDVIASDHNDIAKELIALMTEIGTLIKGSATDLKARLAVSLKDSGALYPSALTTTVPTAYTSPGEPGQRAVDSNYVYFCWDTNLWARNSITQW